MMGLFIILNIYSAKFFVKLSFSWRLLMCVWWVHKCKALFCSLCVGTPRVSTFLLIKYLIMPQWESTIIQSFIIMHFSDCVIMQS